MRPLMPFCIEDFGTGSLEKVILCGAIADAVVDFAED